MMLLCDTTQLYFPVERNASGRLFPPMKRFGLYKPYVKLLHFLLKNTHEVFNRNIGFLSAQKYFIVLFFIQT
jgi:hypothetical protein